MDRNQRIEDLKSACHAFGSGRIRKALQLLFQLEAAKAKDDFCRRIGCLLELEICLELREEERAHVLIGYLRQTPCWKDASDHERAILAWFESRLVHPSTSIGEPPIDPALTPLHTSIRELEIEARRGNLARIKLAADKLISAYASCKDAEKCIIHHAMGCIHAYSFHCYEDAETSFLAAFRLSKACDPTDTPIAMPIIVFHLALAMLCNKKVAKAFNLLLTLLPLHLHDARFWLRLAECCRLISAQEREPSSWKEVHPKARESCLALLERASEGIAGCQSQVPSEINCDSAFGAYACHKALTLATGSNGQPSDPCFTQYVLLMYVQFCAALRRVKELPEVEEKLVALNDNATSSTPALSYNRLLIKTLAGKHEEALAEAAKITNSEGLVEASVKDSWHSLQIYLDMHGRRAAMARNIFNKRDTHA